MTRDQARELFEKSPLTYADLTRKNLQRLRNLINQEMKASDCLNGSFRCKQRPFIQDGGPDRFYAGVWCNAFYFEDREAISFNPDGFVGFAGWAGSENAQPIVDGFVLWVKELTEAGK